MTPSKESGLEFTTWGSRLYCFTELKELHNTSEYYLLVFNIYSNSWVHIGFSDLYEPGTHMHTDSGGGAVLVMDRSNLWSLRGNHLFHLPPPPAFLQGPGSEFPLMPRWPAEPPSSVYAWKQQSNTHTSIHTDPHTHAHTHTSHSSSLTQNNKDWARVKDSAKKKRENMLKQSRW